MGTNTKNLKAIQNRLICHIRCFPRYQAPKCSRKIPSIRRNGSAAPHSS